LVTALIFLTLGTAATVGAGPANAQSTWVVDQTFPYPMANLASVACPSVAECVAVGSGDMVALTDNGGTSWQARTPDGKRVLAGQRARERVHLR
jgi:hypothetical protein